MNKIMKLKIASILLFWFGVIYQLFAIISYSREIYSQDAIQGISMDVIFSHWLFVLTGFMYPLFGHVSHIVIGYLVAKGNKIGAVSGIAIGVWEIVPFLTWDITTMLAEPTFGIYPRILFGIVIFLIISGRKDLALLKLENWRPWKNPKTISTQ